jgi:hypothetical protein
VSVRSWMSIKNLRWLVMIGLAAYLFGLFLPWFKGCETFLGMGRQPSAKVCWRANAWNGSVIPAEYCLVLVIAILVAIRMHVSSGRRGLLILARELGLALLVTNAILIAASWRFVDLSRFGDPQSRHPSYGLWVTVVLSLGIWATTIALAREQR